MEGWVILRCAGAATLGLAASLTDAGFEVWTPQEVQDRRSRKTHKREQVTVAMIPTYLFAKAKHMLDLLDLARSPSLTYRRWDSELRRMVVKGHAHFRVESKLDSRPIRDSEMDAMRMIERKRRPKGKHRTFAIGTRVRINSGAGEGLYGVVQSSKGGFATVLIGDWNIPLQIAGDLLTALDDGPAVHVCIEVTEQPPMANAA